MRGGGGRRTSVPIRSSGRTNSILCAGLPRGRQIACVLLYDGHVSIQYYKENAAQTWIVSDVFKES